MEAVAYVRGKMTVGASNKIEDVVRSFGASLLCVLAIRSVGLPGQEGSHLSWIRAAAAKAEHVGCGNCGENAALAFVYLYDRGIRPLDLMSDDDPDHAFVVVGRTRESDPGDPASWGSEAVVCDPWHGEGRAYPAKEFRLKMYRGEQIVPGSDYRAD